MKLKILKIQKVPWWKPWVDKYEVTAKCGWETKCFRLFLDTDDSPFLLIHWCKNKCLGRRQFDGKYWDKDWENFFKQFSIDEKDLGKVIEREFDL